ncbi:hypothetical protein [Niallia sp. 01092]|uniref:hypothetical protein n=1 Tax=unclassified Niallia TaxID=2837522 RepID=UPI003FD42968
MWITIFLLLIFSIIQYRDIAHPKEPQLTRVDIANQQDEGNKMIVDDHTLTELQHVWDNALWEQSKRNMSRVEDVDIQLFYEYRSDFPKSIEQYKIWFSVNGSTEIINPIDHTYVKLEGEKAKKVKNILLNKTVEKTT